MSDQLPPSSQPFSAPPGPPSTGLAVATLVLGILGVVACPLTGIAAIVTGIIVLVRMDKEPHRYGGRGMAIAGLVCGGVSLVVFPMCVAILLPSLSRARELSKRLVCGANLKGIGLVVQAYSGDWPGSSGTLTIDRLVQQGAITPQQTICPSSDLGLGNYVLVSPRPDRSAGDRGIVAYEPKSNHGGEGGNVAYADGHVEFLRGASYDEAIARLPAAPPK